jgi:signal transduction histidine kinase
MSDELFPRAMSLAVHELRTPVTVVSGYLRMLLREQGGPLTEKQRKMLEEAERSCARIGALVGEMSELGKLVSGDAALGRQEFNLSELLAELAGGMHEGDDRGVQVETRGTNEPVMVIGDRTRLSAAIRALMHAAVRERGDPGVILVQCTVFADTDPPSAVVAIGDEPTVGTLLHDARDAKPPFDEWRGGLGLALPVGRRVIERQGGALWSAAGDQPRAGSALRLPISVSGERT